LLVARVKPKQEGVKVFSSYRLKWIKFRNIEIRDMSERLMQIDVRVHEHCDWLAKDKWSVRVEVIVRGTYEPTCIDDWISGPFLLKHCSSVNPLERIVSPGDIHECVIGNSHARLTIRIRRKKDGQLSWECVKKQVLRQKEWKRPRLAA
jgi:hypothetical protein